MTYTVTQPQRLDTIVFNHYGTLDVLELVLEQNKQYLNKYILDTGDIVILPAYTVSKQNVGTALWD